MMGMMVPGQARRVIFGLVALVGVLLADQASKYWILYDFDLPRKGTVEVLPFLNFTMVWNHAVTFGMLGGLGRSGPLVFCTVALLAVLVLLFMLTRVRKAWICVAVGAIAGGAVGNVIDRLQYGAVVDFLHAHAFGHSWYVFNVADSGIVCGVIAWMIDSLFDRSVPVDQRPGV